jgi:PTS system fructose-specific IIC component
VVVIPVISTLIMGTLMLLVIGPPVAHLQTALTDWLAGLSGANAVLLGALLGLMMASDMGGPFNKVAYTFGLASLASGDIKVMAAVMAAGMTPPVAMALATVLRPALFTRAERRAGEAAWLLGASFITEGAIPFAAADPLRVIPSAMAGSALTGALSMAFGATSRAPHGGIWVLPLIGNPFLWVAAIAAGIVVSAACVVVAKHIGRRKGSVADLESSVMTSAGSAATFQPTGPGPQ